MNDLNTPVKRSTIDNVSVVMLPFDEKIRLISGLGINVIGAGVLLAHGVRFLGGSI